MRRVESKKPRNTPTVSSYELLEPREMMAADVAGSLNSLGLNADGPDKNVIHVPIQAEAPAETNDLSAVHDTYGLTGVGQTVVVIDGGVAYDHYALGGGFGEEHRVVGGWDFAENDADPYDDAPRGTHGTHLTGIVASSDETYPGVAPEVDIVALRVFDDNGGGDFTWIESALSWVHTHRNDFENPITTVNLSVGTDWNSDSIPIWAQLEQELKVLEDDGIFVAVSAGNGFRSSQTVGLSYPAVSPYVVPVASVGATGDLSAFSQRHDRVLAAPGELITSTIPDYINSFDGVVDDFGRSTGTSMAAPYVAGASLLVRQAFEIAGIANITQDVIYDHLRETADEVYDSVTDATYLRVNLDKALKSALPKDLVGDTVATGENLGKIDGDLSLTGWANSAVDTDVFTFTADADGTVSIGELSGGVAVRQVGDFGEASTHTRFDVVAGEEYAFQIEAGELPAEFEANLQFTVKEIVAPAPTPTPDPAPLPSDPGPTNPTSGPIDLPAEPDPVVQVPVEIVKPEFDEAGAIHVATTGGKDQIDIWAGSEVKLVVNGETYRFGGSATSFVLDGATSDDVVNLHGTDGNEVAEVHDGIASIAGDGWQVSVKNADWLNVYANGGDDTVSLHDGSGDDLLVARKDFTILLGAGGRNNRVIGFDHTQVYGQNGGRDVAILHDDQGDDFFRFGYDHSTMIYDASSFGIDATGSSTVTVVDFEKSVGISRQGGYDQAEAHGNAQANLFVARENASYLTGFQENHRAEGFDHVSAYASEENSAWIYDSADDDQLVLSPESSHLTGGYSVSVYGYATIGALGHGGGTDTAIIRDSEGDDTFVSLDRLAIMEGEGFRHVVNGYENVSAISLSGNDRAVIFGSGSHRDKLSNNGVVTEVTNPNRHHSAMRFAEIELKGSFMDALQQNAPAASMQSVNVIAADPGLTLGHSTELKSDRIDQAIVEEQDSRSQSAIDTQGMAVHAQPIVARDLALQQPIPRSSTAADDAVDVKEPTQEDIDALWDSLD